VHDINLVYIAVKVRLG